MLDKITPEMLEKILCSSKVYLYHTIIYKWVELFMGPLLLLFLVWVAYKRILNIFESEEEEKT